MAKTIHPPTTRDELLDAVIDRRASRYLYDANNSTSIEDEMAHTLRYNKPFGEMSTAELLVEWDDFSDEEDDSDYEKPKLCLKVLRAEARKAAPAGAVVPLTAPLTKSAMDKEGWVAGVVAVSLSDVVDLDEEGFLDLLSEKLTGGPLLMDIGWSVVGHRKNTLHLEVKGDASACFRHEGDAAEAGGK